jgi:hypothetical protein
LGEAVYVAETEVAEDGDLLVLYFRGSSAGVQSAPSDSTQETVLASEATEEALRRVPEADSTLRVESERKERDKVFCEVT